MSPQAADPDALVTAGVAEFRRGQFDAAAANARKALKLRPAHAAAQSLLGSVMIAQGEPAKAARAFGDLTRRYPKDASYWMNLGAALRGEGKHESALAAYAQAGWLGEASADYFYSVGLLHLDMGNFEAARTVLHDAARLAPADAEIAYQYAVCCDETMRQEEAQRALEGWPRMQGLTTDLLAKIAMLLMKLGDLRGAGAAVAIAARDPMPDAEAVLRMVQVQERTNQVALARAGLARLKLDPRAGRLGPDLKVVEARLADRDGDHQLACAIYAELLAATPEPHLRHFHLFPFAKALDAGGRHEEAFAALEEAHRSQLAYLRLATPNAPAWKNPPFRIAEFGTVAADVAGWEHAGAPPAAASPVFIVGFPRSGTTLLEQTLDAHPALASMDETRFLYEVIDRMTGGGIVYPEKLAAMTRAQLDEMRALYWSKVRTRIELAPGRRLVDKNPLNLLALPAIRRLFPHARILLAVRHPCDVILSCYMQHFRAPDFTLLCRSLETLAAGYDKAFGAWYREAAILEPPAREVRYETLVAEFEREVRAIAEFLELPWTDAMLAPGAHAGRKGFISTPSYAQVVQPVHTRAIGRWRAYQRQFAGILPQLSPWLARWSYDA
jgi:tetratricopeptide (TPR) repeat protein